MKEKNIWSEISENDKQEKDKMHALHFEVMRVSPYTTVPAPSTRALGRFQNLFHEPTEYNTLISHHLQLEIEPKT